MKKPSTEDDDVRPCRSSIAHLKKLSTLHTLHDHVEETFVLADDAILFKKIKLHLSWVECSKNKVACFQVMFK